MSESVIRYWEEVLRRVCGMIFLIGVFHISAQAQDSNKIDSLRLIYESEELDSLKFKALSKYEREVRNSDRVAALPLMKERVSLAKKLKKNDWLINSYLALGNNYIYLSKNDSARIFINACIELSREENDLYFLSHALNSSATLYQRENNYESAIETYHETILVSDSMGDYVGQLIGYGNLSVILMEQGNPARALEHLLKTDALHSRVKNDKPDALEEFESFLSATYLNTGKCFQELNNHESATYYLEKAKEYLPAIKDEYSAIYYSAYLYHGLANIDVEQCLELKNCNRRKWLELLSELSEAKEGFTAIENDRGVMFTLLDIGRVLDGLGRHEEARDTLLNVLESSRTIGFKELEKDCYKALSENAEYSGKFLLSNRYLKNWTSIRDSIRNEDRDKFTQQKEIELETFQKENEILQLQVQAEAQSRRQAIQLLVFIISLLSVIGGAALIYTRYKLKKERELANFEKQVNLAMSKFVPMAFIRAIGREAITEVELGDQVEKEVTVLFTDIRDFTSISEKMAPSDNFNFVKEYAGIMGPIIEEHNGFVNQYLGDGIMAIFENSPNDALDACLSMQVAIKEYNSSGNQYVDRPLRVGMGMHTGPLVMGIIGDQIRRDATIISDTVNSAARIESTTKMYKHNILISGESYRRLNNKEAYNLTLMGDVQVKGKELGVEVYACVF